MPYLLLILLILCLGTPLAQAQSAHPVDFCPSQLINPHPADFSPTGLILTAFDKQNLWVYDISRNTRYPLPETRPCLSNCQLSPDSRWLIYLNPLTFAYTRMRLNGTERTAIAGQVSEIDWWDANTYLVWSSAGQAYLRPEQSSDFELRQYLPTKRIESIQPSGYWAQGIAWRNDEFWRYLTNLQDLLNGLPNTDLYLAPDIPYYNSYAWSPDGKYLAYTARASFDEEVSIYGSELFMIRPGDFLPRQLTFFNTIYGAVRINASQRDSLAWSPDGRYIAFWLTELLGPDPETDLSASMIHLVDTQTGEVRRYCAFSTTENTPYIAPLIWSPDSSHIAFAGNVPGDNKGYLLLALEVSSGRITELTDGIFPIAGVPEIIAWGPDN